MKILIKSTVAVLITAAVIIFGGLCAFAETNTPEAVIEESGAPAQELTELTPPEHADDIDALDKEGENEEIGEISDTGTGILPELANQIRSNIPEILTTASLAISVILAFIYKKGLLPLLTGTLHRISAAVGEFSKKTEERSEDTRLLTEALKGRLETAEGAVEKISRALEGITLLLDEYKDRQNTAHIVITLFDAQLNLMLDLINSSNLPLTRKEELRAKFGYLIELIGGLKNEEAALQADN